MSAACGIGEVTLDADKTGSSEKPEVWSSADAPTIFTNNLERKLTALPREGQATNIPWAGHYWPIAHDSINYKWDGDSSDSPAVKYGKAFGVANIEDQVSRDHGIDSSVGKECAESSECKSDMGETCGKRTGAQKGRCIPTWWGICHAWAPASILLPEPVRPVTRNGVTFKVQDIKALVTLVHDRTSKKFVSLRCNDNNRANEIHYDDYGRPADSNASCRDTNPGTYHILLANYLGVMKQAFVEDRTFDYQVWNQPLRGYRVTQLRSVTAPEANKLIGVTTTSGGTTSNRSGTVAKDAWARQGSFDVQPNTSYRVAMTGTNDADLYVKFGAEPQDSVHDCRPYASGSAEECSGQVPAGASKMFVAVKGYAAASNFNLAITVGGSVPTAYVFNSAAKSFAYVSAEVDYISESSASTDGNLGDRIDQYTHTDRYEYILELDADGQIIGGEWVGSSKQDHPDFVTLPTGVSGTSVAGGAITYAQVKSLLDESVTGSGGEGGEKTVTQSSQVAKNEFKQYGPFNVAAGAVLTANMTGDNDADLYVRKGMAPTLSSWDCRPYKNGSIETCSVSGPGAVYVAVAGFAASSSFNLVVKYKEASGDAPPPIDPPPAVQHLNVTASVGLNESKVYTMQLPAGYKVKIDTAAANDVDLYIQVNAAPTTSNYLARAYTGSGNETLTYTAASNGVLYIMVHGYQASAFTLKTSGL